MIEAVSLFELFQNVKFGTHALSREGLPIVLESPSASFASLPFELLDLCSAR